MGRKNNEAAIRRMLSEIGQGGHSFIFILSPLAEAGVKGHAAVYIERRSSDVIGMVGSNPYSRLCHINGLSDSLIRDQLQDLFFRLRRAPCGCIDRGLYRPRARCC